MRRSPRLARLVPRLVIVLCAVAPVVASPQETTIDGPTVDEVELLRVSLSGTVFDREGRPAAGAVVVSSAGGQSATDPDGDYRLDVDVPTESQRMMVTALGADGTSSAEVCVDLVPGVQQHWVDALDLAPTSADAMQWLPTFGPHPGASYVIEAMTVFDDGNGPALHVAGYFGSIQGIVASSVARFDGTRWWPLGSGLDGMVLVLAVCDDGSGPALYAGGEFTFAGGAPANRIARWDGQQWSALGEGVSDTVHAITTFDDGSGARVIAGGSFVQAGGVQANLVAAWDGSTWAALDKGVGQSGAVRALAVFDDGSGPRLYAGGSFQQYSAPIFQRMARWDGSKWGPVGGGIDLIVHDLVRFDDGAGARLFACGQAVYGTTPPSSVLTWDGANWGVPGPGLEQGAFEMAALETEFGPRLVVAGAIDLQGAPPHHGVVTWDGSAWEHYSTAFDDDVRVLASFDSGAGPEVYAGGFFSTVSSTSAQYLARKRDGAWSGLPGGLDGDVHALALHDDGSGPALYAAGGFLRGAGTYLRGIGRWTGSAWEALGDGLEDDPFALVSFDAGAGAQLYVSGSFPGYFGAGGSSVLRWDGSSWSTPGEGVRFGVPTAMVVHDEGSGPVLIAAGSGLENAAGVETSFLRWDGHEWTAVGELPSFYAPGGLLSWDDGTGPALYAGVRPVGWEETCYVMRWDGTTWTRVGERFSSSVNSLAGVDLGNGPELFAAGSFSFVGGKPASRIARWDGFSWRPVGGGIQGGSGVYELTAFPETGANVLYAAGSFTSAGGIALMNVARWDGTSWSEVGGGVHGSVTAAQVVVELDSKALVLGGGFHATGTTNDSYLARWGSLATR
jgi:hypothetical protein